MIKRKKNKRNKYQIVIELTEKDLNQIEHNLNTLSKLLGKKINRTRLVTELLLKCNNLEFLHDIGYIPYNELMQHMLFPKFDLKNTKG